jgi:hypothetical protein
MQRFFVKCHRCGRDFFPNQLTTVNAHAGGDEFKICPDCDFVLDCLLGDKHVVGIIIGSSIPVGELVLRYTSKPLFNMEQSR